MRHEPKIPVGALVKRAYPAKTYNGTAYNVTD